MEFNCGNKNALHVQDNIFCTGLLISLTSTSTDFAIVIILILIVIIIVEEYVKCKKCTLSSFHPQDCTKVNFTVGAFYVM